MGAIFFRLVFFVVGEALMHALHFMHLVFGAFLIYTGIKSISDDDDDYDPTLHPLVKWVTQNLNMING